MTPADFDKEALRIWKEEIGAHSLSTAKRALNFAHAIRDLLAKQGQDWKEAVIDELVVCHIYNESHEGHPRKAIKDAISWNVQVALDPLVSSDAQALIDKGRDLVLQGSGEPVAWLNTKYNSCFTVAASNNLEIVVEDCHAYKAGELEPLFLRPQLQPEQPIIGYAVFDKSYERAALYPIGEKDEAFDAARRWNFSLSAITFHPSAPTILSAAERGDSCEEEGCPHYGTPHSHPPEEKEELERLQKLLKDTLGMEAAKAQDCEAFKTELTEANRKLEIARIADKFPLTDAGVDKCFDEMLKRKFPRHADGKGVEDWIIDPRYLKEISDLIPNNDFCPSWEEIEQVLLALERMK